MMLSTFMVLFTIIISTVDCVCTNCNRCVDDKCINAENDGCRCKIGCKPGYFGGKCINPCPEQCVSCGREYGIRNHPTYNICYECTDGYHNGSSTNCLCPLKCQQCTSTTTCTVCNTGWYGGVCASTCPQDCRDNVCSITDGSCIHGCLNGKYGTQCQYQCPTTCKDDVCDQTVGTCTYGCIANFAPGADNKCHECIPGKYGENCDSVCQSTTCLNNECDRDIGTCIHGCMSNFALGENKLCDVCIPGKYGQNCATDCPTTTCLNNECDRENGKCSKGCTSPSLNGPYCNACINGMYGDNCQFTCPNNCKDNVCSRYPGTCTNGCKADQFTGNKCNQCAFGYYGEHCNTTCPVNCQYNTCTKDKGECSLGCVGNFTGRKCDVCKVGYYGNNCGLLCPSSSCNDNVCDRKTGQCEKCSPGMYGSFCNQTCSVDCISNECDQLNGNCDNGCIFGYIGNKCCNSKGYCEQCRNTTHCNQCITGYFGDNCILSCPENCVNGCSMGNGICTFCKHGFFGPECESECSKTCYIEQNTDICDWKTGKCLLGCVAGYYNIRCTDYCKYACLDNSCNQYTGKCDGCIFGYHGDKCDKHCSKQCVNNTCTQDGGICTNGSTDDSRDKHCLKDNDKESQTTLPIGGAIVSWVALVCSVIANVILVIYLLHKRRQARTPTETREMIQNIGQHTYANDFIDDEEPSEVHVYEGLDENRLEDKTTYSTPDPVNV